MNHKTQNNLFDIIIIIIFLLLISCPLIISVIEDDKILSWFEKREFAKYPGFPKTLKSIQTFPELFNAYYSDQFGLRSSYTQFYKITKYLIGDSPSNDVTIGKNGWLFLGSIKNNYTKYGDPIRDVMGINLYSKRQLEDFTDYMIELNTWLNNKGVEYVLVIAPTKHSIYFDQLPEYITKFNSKTATDQLVKYLRENTNIIIVDPRDKLIKTKEEHQVYYKRNTHWNSYAANVVQYMIMNEIEKMFPGMIKPELKSIKVLGTRGSDLLDIIGINRHFRRYILRSKEPKSQPIFEGTCQPSKYPYNAKDTETHTFICETQNLKAVIYRNSFFTELQPYFSRKFYRSTYIWDRLTFPSLVKYVDIEKPDVVVEQWVERRLPFVPKKFLDK